MGRIASIHVREDHLIKLIEEAFDHIQDEPFSPELFARVLVNKAKGFSCTSRGVLVSNNKLNEKVEKLKLSSRSDAGIFAQMLVMCRRRKHHRGIQIIHAGDPEWFNLKDACKQATDFCNEFQLRPKEGYPIYINLGLDMMKNFSLGKFKSLHAAICNKYEAIQEIEKDRTPEKTKQAHDAYLAILAEKTGFGRGYHEMPEKYQYFIKVKEEALKYGVTPKQYIQAQFHAFDWRSGVPDPMQLVGPKAIDRLQRWAFEHNFRLGESNKKGIDFKKIKNG